MGQELFYHVAVDGLTEVVGETDGVLELDPLQPAELARRGDLD
jgi:hypothetical protein